MPAGILAIGGPAGEAPSVQVLDAETGEERFAIQAFEGSMQGGVRVGVGDVNGDGVDDIVAAEGSRQGSGRVRTFDGRDGSPLPGPLGGFEAFGPAYQGGAYVAVGDVNRDGHADLIVGTDGAGRYRQIFLVRVFSGEDGSLLEEFSAELADGRLGSGGVRVAAGDFNHDDRVDVVTATGRGGMQLISIRSLGGGEVGLLAQHQVRSYTIIHIAAADVTRDFRSDVLISTHNEIRVLELDDGRLNETDSRRVRGRLGGPIGAVDYLDDDVTDIVIGRAPRPRNPHHVSLFHGQTREPLTQLSLETPRRSQAPFVAGTLRDHFNPLTYSAVTEFDVLDRLGVYNPATGAFDPIGTPAEYQGKNVYFIAHGWAPDWGPAVDQYAQDHPGDFLKWWQTTDPNLPKLPDDFPASAWMFEETDGPNQFVVSPVGLAESIAAADADAVVIAYSWIDESATDNVLQGYQSEAYTFMNGHRLANAAQMALGTAASFTGQIHLLGHSHGAKVATVAALALQQADYPVWQLTTLDSADSASSDIEDATNFAWFYMRQMDLGRDPAGEPGTVFIDNYVSQFSERFGTFPGLAEVVDVHLCPGVLYGLDPGSGHSYAPAWYAGANVAPVGVGEDGLGLGWSPLLHPDVPGGLGAFYMQEWTTPNQEEQFVLTEKETTPPAMPSRVPSFADLPLADVTSQGMASYDANTGAVTLTETSAEDSPSLTGTIDLNDDTVGISFDFTFADAGDGDQLSITVGGSWSSYQFFLVTGEVVGTHTYRATLSVAGLGGMRPITFALAGTGSANASVTIGNLQQFAISGNPLPVC